MTRIQLGSTEHPSEPFPCTDYIDFAGDFRIQKILMRFEWDEGNWPKCGKHGVSKDEIEDIFESDPRLSVPTRRARWSNVLTRSENPNRGG